MNNFVGRASSLSVLNEDISRSGDIGSFRRRAYLDFGKRVLDILLVLPAIPVATVIILCCAVAAALDGGNPFYTQERVGRGGRIFRMFKLRTMVVDAETCLESYLQRNAAARSEWATSQKLRKDPRITRVGRFLRRTSLDELPQLFNVLIGDMSLVGPRPMLPEQRALYTGHNYTLLRPGITGPWQVSERNAAPFSDRAIYDDFYWRVVSFRTDVAMLVRTIRVLMRPNGF